MDVAGELLLYDKCMTRVYLADAQPDERKALRVLLLDLKMQIVGESADWSTTLANAPETDLDMLLVDWDLLPTDMGVQSLVQLRLACPNAIVVVLISHLDARHQAALSAGADTFISKGETPERVAERLRAVAESIHI
jgi:DNA-binding NarL/FixJ family response regulator